MASGSNGALIVTANGAAVAHRDVIITTAARHKLRALYRQRRFVTAGGLISYGEDGTDQYTRAAGYAYRILKGEKPADLPVQAPTKYETGDQPQDREGAASRAAVPAKSRRRSDRIDECPLIDAVDGSSTGT